MKICDRCKKERGSTQYILMTDTNTIDLCDFCIKDLKVWIKEK